MSVQDIKQRIDERDYVVDPQLVAEAMLRHAISYRRWWNPRSPSLTPPDTRFTPGD